MQACGWFIKLNVHEVGSIWLMADVDYWCKNGVKALLVENI